MKRSATLLWVLATLSLTGWWLIYGLKQAELISHLQNLGAADVVRHQYMLLSEGLVLMTLLLIGGVALYRSVNIEVERTRQVREFFAVFTHDLKTALTSLCLQAEALEELLVSYSDPTVARITKRLVKDSMRLGLQLENSLMLADEGRSQIHIENINLKNMLSSLKSNWPDLQIDLSLDSGLEVLADCRGLESIFKNSLQNAVLHGGARCVTIRARRARAPQSGKATKATEPTEDQRVVIDIQDDGRGYSGNPSALGQIFSRPTKTSGSGIGLYLSVRWAQQMGGDLEFMPQMLSPEEQHFEVEVPPLETKRRRGFSLRLTLLSGQAEDV